MRFTREMSQWEPETFVRSVLVEWLRVAEVWVGADFQFGRERSGNFTLLRSLGAQHGFRAEKIDPIRYKDFIVSSTRIRRLVSEGRVDEAGALLGHHYAIDGTVVEGAKRGREIGFPTANISTSNELIPPHGVYATALTIDGQLHPSVTNVGQRPTFGDQLATTIECHVLRRPGMEPLGRTRSIGIRPAPQGRAQISRPRTRSRNRSRRMFAAHHDCSIDYLSDS